MDPRVVTTRRELDEVLFTYRLDRQQERRIGLVPTMGALHAGHRALIRTAHRTADFVVVSLFVNPLQFGPTEDLARYPRPLDDDLAAAAEEGAGLVWAPSVEEMYPAGEPQVMVSAGRLGGVLEGAARPGHFDGVLTVVAKLIHQVRPDEVFFGAKDAQQVVLVRRMVADLDFDRSQGFVRVVDTVRDGDGLAMSSRNARLSDPGRQTATALHRALSAAGAVRAGPPKILAAARAVLDAEPGLMLDYLALVDLDTFDPIPPTHRGEARLVVAGVVEGVRLIDNMKVVCG